MATLRTPVKYLDAIMDKISKKVYIVLHEELHHLWVIQDGGGEAPFEMQKSKVNLAFVKVDPKVVRVLYGKDENTDTVPNADAAPTESAE